MNIAIIPARGGSKRIPRKNIKSFCGKPIIAYSILAAKEVDIFDRIKPVCTLKMYRQLFLKPIKLGALYKSLFSKDL